MSYTAIFYIATERWSIFTISDMSHGVGGRPNTDKAHQFLEDEEVHGGFSILYGPNVMGGGGLGV